MERQELDGIARSEGGLVAVTKVISSTQVNLIMISSKNDSDQDFMVKKWFQSLSLGGGRGCSDSYRVQRVFSSAQVLVAINHCHHLHPRHSHHHNSNQIIFSRAKCFVGLLENCRLRHNA